MTRPPLSLVAREPFTFAGISVAAGEVFEVPPVIALALFYQRKVIAAPAPRVDRQRYRRTDLRADP